MNDGRAGASAGADPEHNHGSFGCDEHCPAFDAGTDPEPRTEAGRDMLETLPDYVDGTRHYIRRDLRERILAIEAEARAQGGPSPEPTLEVQFWKAAGEWQKAGSGMTREQETGAAMVWSWLSGRAQGGPSLDVERLALAWFIGIQARSGIDRDTAIRRWNGTSDPDVQHLHGVYGDVAAKAAAEYTRLGVAPKPPDHE